MNDRDPLNPGCSASFVSQWKERERACMRLLLTRLSAGRVSDGKMITSRQVTTNLEYMPPEQLVLMQAPSMTLSGIGSHDYLEGLGACPHGDAGSHDYLEGLGARPHPGM